MFYFMDTPLFIIGRPYFAILNKEEMVAKPGFEYFRAESDFFWFMIKGVRVLVT